MNQRTLEQYLADFETAWADALARDEQGSIRLEQFVPPAEHPEYQQTIVELARVHLELGWQSGERVFVERYQSQFPDVFEQAEWFDQIAFEEYRIRNLAGHSVSPGEYRQRFSLNTNHWPVIEREPTKGERESVGDEDRESAGSNDATRPELAARLIGSGSFGFNQVQHTLHRRLRFASLVFVAVLAYLAFLVMSNPVAKVGLFLGSDSLVILNIVALVICVLCSLVLWLRSEIPLSTLRFLELTLFGLVLFELGAGLYSDLFYDHELREPLSEGDHALFHYSSSWSLPFFALIIAYGTIIPSSWRRCTVVVAIMATIPLAISVAGAAMEQGLSKSFWLSFFLQMAIWMAIAAAIAIYGVHRIEILQRKLRGQERVGSYQLIRQLASGGMGEIYLAEHTLLNRLCAIKLMRSELLGDAQLFTRFEREVTVLAGISHPNAVKIFDFGYTDCGTFYYVMEYLEGSNLRNLVEREGVIKPERVRSILLEICSALKTLHAGGLIHRDIKPSNIFICNESDSGVRTKLLDFGLVKVTDEGINDELTQDGAIIGTPAFMSPEQAVGSRTDSRTDLYSLGAVAYFMLSGKPPFVRNSVVETLSAHIRDRHEPLDRQRSDLPTDLVDIVHRCLAKHPDLRFGSVDELECALQGALQGAVARQSAGLL